MLQLITESDFDELPEEPSHKWLILEKTARNRLEKELENTPQNKEDILKLHYMNIVTQLAREFDVSGVGIGKESNFETKFDNFQLSVARAQSSIWAGSQATYPFGRVALGKDSKLEIIRLTAKIEKLIESLDISEQRQRSLQGLLADFKREIHEPKTRIGSALSKLAQVSTVVAMTTTTAAQADDAFSNIMNLLGAETIEASSNNIQLLEAEKQLLLAAPPKQIEGPKAEK
jgi:hypothetical protein